MSTNSIMATLFFISFGEFGFAQGTYYEGEKVQWKDMDVPQRPDMFHVWVPNPDRPTFADWLYDGHDQDGGYWELP